jgi:hypothetical protein
MAEIRGKMNQSLYTSGAIQELADYYIDNGGEVFEVVEGTLGWGTTVMVRDGWKSAVVQEVYVNEWSSAHKVRMYIRLPNKYQTMLDEYQNVA